MLKVTAYLKPLIICKLHLLKVLRIKKNYKLVQIKNLILKKNFYLPVILKPPSYCKYFESTSSA